LRAGRLCSGCGGLPLAGSVGAEHLAGKAAMCLAEAFGQIPRGAKSQGAGEAGGGCLPMVRRGEGQQCLGKGDQVDRVGWVGRGQGWSLPSGIGRWRDEGLEFGLDFGLG
jgi:hypothetical protein